MLTKLSKYDLSLSSKGGLIFANCLLLLIVSNFYIRYIEQLFQKYVLSLCAFIFDLFNEAVIVSDYILFIGTKFN